MKAYQRFIEYAKVSTGSDPENEAGHQPTTQRQFTLGRMLAEEMKAMGITDAVVDDKCYVYGHIPASPGCENVPGLGFIAHMDTAYEASGEGVEPILHQNYDGGDVVLPKGHTIEVAKFPELKEMKGQTLITASGDTLLGADDKAGIAEILTACERVLKGDVPHGRLCIAFTPDEEVGRGAEGFDVEGFGAKWAYTLDGGAVEEVEYETFNGATAKLAFTGVDSHPGEAKDVMVNALRLAMEFDAMLPAADRPEKTEDREGFYHIYKLVGNQSEAASEYLIRDHDREKFEARKQAMKDAAAQLEKRYYLGCAQVTIIDSYYNMGEVVEQHFHLIENARQAVKAIGLTPVTKAVRGGTDGSVLSYMGLPCPNLGTGGHYFHGLSECVTAEAMEQAVEVILGIIKIYSTFTP